MPRYLCVDIETVGHPEAENWLGPVEPDARLKDPAKIAESIKTKTDERNEKLGLDPDCCRIVALGYHVVGGNEPVCALCVDEEQERFALERFWLAYTAVSDTVLVTFYGHSFDLPVLLRRSMYLGVRHPKISLDKYRSPHIDVWNELTYRGVLRTAHGLKFYQKRFGLPALDKVDGADVGELWAKGEYEAVRDHCLSDVGLTHSLANKLGLLQL